MCCRICRKNNSYSIAHTCLSPVICPWEGLQATALIMVGFGEVENTAHVISLYRVDKRNRCSMRYKKWHKSTTCALLIRLGVRER